MMSRQEMMKLMGLPSDSKHRCCTESHKRFIGQIASSEIKKILQAQKEKAAN